MKWHRVGMIATGFAGMAAISAAADHVTTVGSTADNVTTVGSTADNVTPVGCNCQKGGGGAMVVPSPVDTPSLMQLPQPISGAGPWAMGVGAGPMSMTPMIAQPAPNLPPGTLGQTYLRPSAPVPAVKHPRAGLIDVRATGATSVSVQWTHPYRTVDELDGFVDKKDKDLFHFEEKQMIPGNPYIVRIEARYGTEDKPRYEERYARLIMGRVVTVEF